ncbi:CLL_collapsed_G0029450.mRNA.1.CDS.1 [Saccharomyces cerevisiae]|nr:CLL_collapsed_G0029450.mRNA.1.CDS.1 [Saccharomyces cerevisiae]
MICYFIVFGELPFEPQLDIVDFEFTLKFWTDMKVIENVDDEVKPILFTIIDARPTAKTVEETLDEMLINSKPGKKFWKENVDSTLNFSTISEVNENTNSFTDDYIDGDNVTLSLPT